MLSEAITKILLTAALSSVPSYAYPILLRRQSRTAVDGDSDASGEGTMEVIKQAVCETPSEASCTGIIFTGACVGLLVVCTTFYCWRKKRRAKREKETQKTATANLQLAHHKQDIEAASQVEKLQGDLKQWEIEKAAADAMLAQLAKANVSKAEMQRQEEQLKAAKAAAARVTAATGGGRVP